MKKQSIIGGWFPVILGSIILLFSGCEKKKSDSAEYSELSKAIAKAWENVDVDMPNADLKEILGGDVDANGTAAEGWSFYFGKEETQESYGIDVYIDGEVFSWDPGGCYFLIGISDYTSTDVAAWVQVADEATPWIDKSLNYRELQVRSEDGDGDHYPQTTDYVILFYKPNEGGEPVTYVEIDAEDHTVLHVEPNP